jgi:hypothetical protein
MGTIPNDLTDCLAAPSRSPPLALSATFFSNVDQLVSATILPPLMSPFTSSSPHEQGNRLQALIAIFSW